MKTYQLLMLLTLLCGLFSCTQDNSSTDIHTSDLIGHWNITVPSGLQFIEFISDTKVLIGDRGAIGDLDTSQHYYHDYDLSIDNEVINLPSGCKMINLNLQYDRLTFEFTNPTTGYTLNYYADRVRDENLQNPEINILNKAWITSEENGQPIKDELKKLAYFSKASIYFLKDIAEDDLQMYSWEWDATEEELCYRNYQRPTLIPQVTCLDFIDLREDRAIFEVDGNYIMMVPSEEI